MDEPDEPDDFDDILVPTDGSKSARRGAEQAIKFARRNGATLHVLYAMDMGDADYVAVPSDIKETRNRLKKKGEAYVAEVAELAAAADVQCVTTVTSNTPIEAIGEYVAEHDIDLVVMGKRGRSDPDKPLLGSITNRVVGSLDVPVFTA
ncbi:Nucleotide-binding universal stress protein, UspA family [Halopelagius inordinatus]|uniref:Nucleotide-binding universal stress protein, UspA family n=1 Tax=Halopelagius inordinatus TaxID=553467 RepID=A0A1I2RJL1_9EURY|nr:universal stress protein [Halopelagius inordinatus]SFG40874.1 Nucleotide-binding universal stress protein, UspA family [Halopelagius inordinatus]